MLTDAGQLRKLAQEYKVVYEKTSGKTPDDYLIDHSAGTYIYDQAGRLRLLMPYGSGPDMIAHDLKSLLASALDRVGLPGTVGLSYNSAVL